MLNRNYKIPYDIVLIDYITTSLHSYMFIYPNTCPDQKLIFMWQSINLSYLNSSRMMLLPISGTYWQQLQRWLPTPLLLGHRPLPHGPLTTNLPSFLKDSSIPIQAGESETHATYLLVLSQPFLGAACVFLRAMSSEEEFFFFYLCLVLWRIFGYILTPTNWRETIPNFWVKLAEELTSGWVTGWLFVTSF